MGTVMRTPLLFSHMIYIKKRATVRASIANPRIKRYITIEMQYYSST